MALDSARSSMSMRPGASPEPEVVQDVQIRDEILKGAIGFLIG